MSKEWIQDWTVVEIDQWKADVGQRLRKAITKRYGKRNEYQFAQDIGISQGSLSDIVNGRSSPSALTLLKIKENTTISINYILKG
jgi:transcriptional regulator with XRE-family HTH domain